MQNHAEAPNISSPTIRLVSNDTKDTFTMPKATKGQSTRQTIISPQGNPDMICLPGVLVQCDPSIKAIIAKIDGERHEFIIEDLDDEAVVVKESKLAELKELLADVSCMP